MKSKKIKLITVVILLGIVIAACAPDVRLENPPVERTTQAAQNIDTPRVPTWAEGLDLSSDEVFSVSFHVDWPGYRSIEALAASAERYIARVEVLDERVALINDSLSGRPDYNINTVHRLRVLEVFKGNTQAGEIIEVRQLGGQLNNLEVINLDFVPLTIGEELVVFLSGVTQEDFPELDWSSIRPAVVMNPWQGIYRMPAAREGDMAALSDDTVLESLHPDNNLVLTLGDLQRIAQAN